MKNTFYLISNSDINVKAKTYKKAIDEFRNIHNLTVNKRDILKLGLSNSDYMNYKFTSMWKKKNYFN